MSFRIRAHIDVPTLRGLAEHPRLRELAGRLSSEHGMAEPRARRFVEHMLSVVLNDFGEAYLGEISARIDRIVHLREQIGGVYEAVINNGDMPVGISPSHVEGLFRDLDREMASLRSPTRAAHDGGLVIRDDVASRGLASLADEEGRVVTDPRPLPRQAEPPPPPPGAHAGDVQELFGEIDRELRDAPSPDRPRGTGRPPDPGAVPSRPTYSPGEQRAVADAFGELQAPPQRAIGAAAEQAPDLVARAIFADAEGSFTSAVRDLRDLMRRDGMGSEAIDALEVGLRKLNQARRRHGREPDSPTGTLDANLRAQALAGISDPALRAAMDRSPALQRIAHANPEHLAALWAEYRASGSTATFRQYVGRRMISHVRGMGGEFHAAFALGDGLWLLKGPDYDVTIPGTDLVGVVRSSGEVWLMDNKAVSGEQLGTVGSLTRNLVGNIAEDAAEFRGNLRGQPTVDPVMADAVRRLRQASVAIRRITRGMAPDEVNQPAVQLQIQGILDVLNIRRVVTNAGGEIQGLSEGLRTRGVDFVDLMR
jgi:hypothetical protein